MDKETLSTQKIFEIEEILVNKYYLSPEIDDEIFDLLDDISILVNAKNEALEFAWAEVKRLTNKE